jgi:hypothetical protein
MLMLISILLIFFTLLQVSRKLEPDKADDDAQMAAIRQVVHAMAGRRTLLHAQFAARLAKKKVPVARGLHNCMRLSRHSPALQLQQRTSSSNMRVGSSHGTEAEAQMKRLRLACSCRTISSLLSRIRNVVCAFDFTHTYQAAHADAGLVEGRRARARTPLLLTLWR